MKVQAVSPKDANMNASRSLGFALLGAVLPVFGACGPKTSTWSRPASGRDALSEKSFFDSPSRPGLNVLEVKVTNLWNNRLMGDLLDPGHKSAARTNMVLKVQDMIPAGLFGPVTIRRAAGDGAGVTARR